MRESNKAIVLAGCSVLTLDDDGLVAASREYWQAVAGRHGRPPEWGWEDPPSAPPPS